MSANLATVTRDALALSAEEKLALAQELVANALAESPMAHQDAWNEEVRRRREEVRSGRVKLVSAAEVERSLDRLLGR
jgi:putative addiction module component (TIGR02574 family)